MNKTLRSFRVVFTANVVGDEPAGRRVTTIDAENEQELREIFRGDLPGHHIVKIREIFPDSKS